MRFLLLLLASLFISLAWLIPTHYHPWVTYTGELYTFFALFALAALYLKAQLLIPKISLPLLALAAVPLIQFGFGEVFFFSKALLCSIFVFAFWLCIVLGYNLSQGKIERVTFFTGLSTVFLINGVITAIIAICQWLTVDAYIPGMVDLHTSRPYANFAQPNNMATFLIMSLLAGLYLFDKQKVKTWILSLCSFGIIFAIALSQSRASWIACLCILAYGLYQSHQGLLRIKWYQILLWIGLYITFVLSLPALDLLISQTTQLDISETASAVERATSGHLRLGIWQQMLYAISDRPLWGYGWQQTSVAQIFVSEYYQIPEWVKSSHNIVLDLLVWNGLIIGLPLLVYFGYWGYKMLRGVHSTESVIAILMIGIVLIHALLEYPLFYAYFLLPFGLLIGIVQSQNTQTAIIKLSPYFMRISFVIGLILTLLICRDYDVVADRLNQVIRYEKTPEKITNQTPIYVLDEFDRRIDWIRLNPYTKVSPEEIRRVDEMVVNYPIRYDLLKYAKLLAYNGYEKEAKHQLWRLKVVRKLDVDYDDLLKDAPKP